MSGPEVDQRGSPCRHCLLPPGGTQAPAVPWPQPWEPSPPAREVVPSALCEGQEVLCHSGAHDVDTVVIVVSPAEAISLMSCSSHKDITTVFT